MMAMLLLLLLSPLWGKETAAATPELPAAYNKDLPPPENPVEVVANFDVAGITKERGKIIKRVAVF